MLRYSLFAGPFGYGRDKTATRPRVRKHLIIIIPKNFLFKSIFYTRYIPFTSPFYLFSFLSLPAALPCRCDFSHAKVQRHSVVKYRSANRLADLPGSLPKSKMTFRSPPCCAVGLGIPFNPRRFPCLFLIFPLSGLHVKSIPIRKPEQLPKKGKKKFNE